MATMIDSLDEHMTLVGNATQIGQVQLRLHYQSLVRQGCDLPLFPDVEFKCFSQNGEDGILLYLFSLIGAVNRSVVEICAGDGTECNAANLIVNHGWQGLLFDGDSEQVARGEAFYAACRTTWVSPPTFVDAWITAENVNALVSAHGAAGQVDLLSLDIDGNDYWDLESPRLHSASRRRARVQRLLRTGTQRHDVVRSRLPARSDHAAVSLRCIPPRVREARSSEGLSAGRRPIARLQCVLRPPRHRRRAASRSLAGRVLSAHHAPPALEPERTRRNSLWQGTLGRRVELIGRALVDPANPEGVKVGLCFVATRLLQGQIKRR